MLEIHAFVTILFIYLVSYRSQALEKMRILHKSITQLNSPESRNFYILPSLTSEKY